MKRYFLPVIVIFAVFSAAFGQQCCVTGYADSLMQIMKIIPQVTNISVSPDNSCTWYHMTYETPPDRHQATFQIVNTVDLRVTFIHTPKNGDPSRTNDTTYDNWCIGRTIIKGTVPLNSFRSLSAMPNPFHSQVTFDFENPCGNAVLEVFDASGVRVHEVRGIRGLKLVWQPVNLKQGVYLAKVTAGGKAHYQQMIYAK